MSQPDECYRDVTSKVQTVFEPRFVKGCTSWERWQAPRPLLDTTHPGPQLPLARTPRSGSRHFATRLLLLCIRISSSPTAPLPAHRTTSVHRRLDSSFHLPNMTLTPFPARTQCVKKRPRPLTTRFAVSLSTHQVTRERNSTLGG